jgi:hypothetical protein
MPYADVDIYKNGAKAYTQNKDVSLAAAMGLARQYYSGGALYDLQLLPFCPVQYLLNENGHIDIPTGTVFGTISSGTGDNRTEKGVVLFPVSSTFTFDIQYAIDVPDGAIEQKIMNETEMYRLCSPNYNGAFEFSPAKNGGVAEFNVDCQYKPYSPYIHINPNFGGMYGSDFDDARGLICGGDFSLPIITDAWATYELQNKNYQKIFDRQIENMDFNNDIQHTMDVVGAITGGLTGAASAGGAGAAIGGLAGAAAGGPIGLAIGAGVGVAAGVAGGIADVYLNDKLRSEARDYTIDQYGYQLGNIKALPYSLAKITAYNNNNKLFPFVEKYSATEEEKQALRDKLTYDGMTVMTIGTLAEYQQATPSYIKGRLIRLLNSTTLDFHGLSELANEIYQGVFI